MAGGRDRVGFVGRAFQPDVLLAFAGSGEKSRARKPDLRMELYCNMSSTAVFEGRPSNGDATLPADAHWRRIRFVKEAPPGCEVLLRLPDPSPHSAVCVNTELPSAAGIDIVTVPRLPSDHLGGAEDLVKWVGEASGSPPGTITLTGDR